MFYGCIFVSEDIGLKYASLLYRFESIFVPDAKEHVSVLDIIMFLVYIWVMRVDPIDHQRGIVVCQFYSWQSIY